MIDKAVRIRFIDAIEDVVNEICEECKSGKCWECGLSGTEFPESLADTIIASLDAERSGAEWKELKMPKSTRLRRFALTEESGEIRYVGVFVDGFHIVHEVNTMWIGYIRADQMQRFLKGLNGDRLELVFMDGEDCEWRPKEEGN